MKIQWLGHSCFLITAQSGVRVLTEDGWWLLRASNTQNVLVTRCEAQSAEGLERLKTMVKNEVAKIGYSVSFVQ